MPCIPVKLPNGLGDAIVCSRGGKGSRPASCAYCGDRSSRLCDFPVTRVQRDDAGNATSSTKGTCDTPLCVRCTTSIAGDGDLCREHAPLYKTMGTAAP